MLLKKHSIVFILLYFIVKISFAQVNIDSLLKVIKTSKPDTQKVNVYNILSQEFANFNIDSSLLFAKQAYALADKLEFSDGKALSLLSYSNYYNIMGISDSSISVLKRAENFSKKKITFSRIYNAFGSTYDSRGEVNASLNYYNKSLKICKEINNNNGIASVLSNIGFLYQKQGNYTESLNNFLQSLDVFKKLDNEMAVANVYNLIGNVYYYKNNYHNSLKNYFMALDIYIKNKYDLGVAYSYGNISGCFNKEKKYLKALKASYLALNIFEKYGSPQDISAIHVEIGNILIAQHKNTEALNHFNLALKLSQASKDKNTETVCLYHIGLYYLMINKTDKAFEFFKNSLDIAKEIKSLEDLKNNYFSISILDSIKGDYKSALSNYKLFILYRDSINNIDGIKKQSQLEARYEFDIKVAQDSINYAKSQELKNAEIGKQAAQLNAKRNQQIALFVGLFLVMVFAGFMYNRFKVTQKQKKIIEAKEIETQKQKEIIINQKHIVEEKQKEIVDSIQYARRIQNTILAHSDFLNENLPPHFVYFNPKDIVSGDFYWAIKKDNDFYLAVCDSTGHGVPGAFMSLLNTNFLNEAIIEKNISEPHLIFNYVRERLFNTISKDGQRDGFDGILVKLNSKQLNVIHYAAANNAPILIRKNEIIELPKDKMPVGKGEKEQSFTLQTIILENSDSLYLYTDGYADQFGGPLGKKFKYKPLNELILSIHNKLHTEQLIALESTFKQWKGDLEQVDDVCVIGISF